MKRLSHPILLVLAAFFLGAAATQPSSPLLSRAQAILQDMKATTYQHKTEIDEAAGKFLCDCSGFVGFIVKKELPRHWARVPKAKNHSRPTASDFHDFFITCPTQPRPADLWQNVHSIADAQPGDVLVWRANDPIPKGASTGHVMLIAAPPRRTQNDNTWAIVIIDSTSRAHHQDTRKPDETGVGRGTVFVRTDDQGHPIAYSSRKPQGPFAKHDMSIGRALPVPSASGQ